MLTALLIMPLLAALISFLAGKGRIDFIEKIAMSFLFVQFATVVYFVKQVVAGKTLTDNVLFLDPLGSIFLLIISFVAWNASLYSVGYLNRERVKEIIGPRRVWQYFVLFHLFIFAMSLSVLAKNPIVTWAAIEATTLATVFLVSFYNKPSSIEAAWKYLIINSTGLLIGFFGTLSLLSLAYGGASGTEISWVTLWQSAALLNPLAVKIAFIFILVGYGTKVGLAPMHTWLPDAHSKAPAPISALLSGVLLNTAFLAVLRFKAAVDITEGKDFTSHLFIFFGFISVLTMAFMLLFQRNYKRLLAYSSIENMGIATLGFGFGGVGVVGALFHVIYHALAKSALFFTAGNIFLKFSSTKIKNVSGALRVLPVTAPLLLIAMFAITGTPPFGTFLSKFSILAAGAALHPYIVFALLVLFILIFVGFLKHFSLMVFGPLPSPETCAPRGVPTRGEFGILTILPICILLSTLLLLSFAIPDELRNLIFSAAKVYMQ